MATQDSNPYPEVHLYADAELQALVRHLAARYPGVVIVSARMKSLDDGTRQQNIDYAGPIEKLLEYGLVTQAMIANSRGSRCGSLYTPEGNGFSLFDGPIDELSASLCPAGGWCLSIYVNDAPRERERFNVKAAERLLRQFRLPRRRKVRA
jgi:hypothetical protein